ncbi:hypothetical protein MKX03_004425, partial [Papaver bracteatum]
FDEDKWDQEKPRAKGVNVQKTIQYCANFLRYEMDHMDGAKDERPTALIGGYDTYKVGDHPLGPQLYHVSADFVHPVHESPDRFACVGSGEDIARMSLTPHFGASHSPSLDQTIFLAKRSLAQAGDNALTGDFITTVAIWDGEIYDYSTNDTTYLRRLHRLGPVRRHLI